MSTLNFNYFRDDITSGIIHFGVGNFHRAHAQAYTNMLLEDESQQNWGICGAMLMPGDETLFRALKSQQGVYSLTICGRKGDNQSQWIGSLVELYWAGENSAQIIAKVADKNIKIITLTITEGGYNIDTEAVRYDIVNPSTPRSVFGFVAEGLRARRASGNGPITILSCDNLQHNGDTCKRVFSEFFSLQDPSLASWVRDNVTFPNSMVDRITPATTPTDVDRLNQNLNKQDKAPVYCEDFLQWVIEDNFVAGRPRWQDVGAQFTDDVSPFENMKLSLLNASHTLLSYASVLMGYRRVDKAMGDSLVVKFVRDFMDKDATPFVPAPENIDLEEYKQTLIERFANSSVSDQVLRLCGDGASKFPVYVMPILEKMIASKMDLKRIAFLLATYYHYLKNRSDDNGDYFEIFEPQLQGSDFALLQGDEAQNFLSASPFVSADLGSNSEFVELYLSYLKQIRDKGVRETLALL
ncbi:MAG: mannitol dehydrogenase family protein [Rikenellaceae bacterium]